jgi:hypothetical protein
LSFFNRFQSYLSIKFKKSKRKSYQQFVISKKTTIFAVPIRKRKRIIT